MFRHSHEISRADLYQFFTWRRINNFIVIVSQRRVCSWIPLQDHLPAKCKRLTCDQPCWMHVGKCKGTSKPRMEGVAARCLEQILDKVEGSLVQKFVIIIVLLNSVNICICSSSISGRLSSVSTVRLVPYSVNSNQKFASRVDDVDWLLIRQQEKSDARDRWMQKLFRNSTYNVCCNLSCIFEKNTAF